MNKSFFIQKLEKLLMYDYIEVSTKFINYLNELEESDILKNSLKIKKNKKNFTINLINKNYIENFINNNKIIKTKNRRDMSIYNNTHSTNCLYSLLTIINNNVVYNKIFNDKNELESSSKFQQNKIVVIIENLDPFIEYKKILLKTYLKINKEFDNIDIIYGNGKNILNPKNIMFLNKYLKVFTFFDLDKTGFEMYISLKKSLKLVENLYVDNIEDYFLMIKNNNYEWKKDLFSFIKDNKSFLSENDKKILNLIDKYGNIEQEIFLRADYE